LRMAKALARACCCDSIAAPQAQSSASARVAAATKTRFIRDLLPSGADQRAQALLPIITCFRAGADASTPPRARLDNFAQISILRGKRAAASSRRSICTARAASFIGLNHPALLALRMQSGNRKAGAA